MRTWGKTFEYFSRLPIRLCLYGWWMGMLLLAAVYTVFFYAWQGFSPDGPPPGFQPEPIGWFFLKYFPLMFLGVTVQFWWFALPLLALTIMEIRRMRAANLKPRRPSAYDLD
jgi:hypothetical protein